MDQPSSSPERPADGGARRRGRLPWIAGAVVIAVLLALAGAAAFLSAYPQRAPAMLYRTVEDWTGANPHPVVLLRPAEQPLSALALIGRQMFYDPALSASGKQSCVSCHDPARAFGPPNDRDVQLGGPGMTSQGLRPPPSLAYLYRQEVFSIGPAQDADEPIPLNQVATKAKGVPLAIKSAATTPATIATVPRGGLFWDGRADTLMAQATGPMMNPAEMANRDEHDVVEKVMHAKYATQFKPLFGPNILNDPAMLFAEAMSALSRYQIEALAFHRFDSKYDRWLEGKARLSRVEMRGLRLFNDPAKGNCAGCHLSQPSRDGLPPLFTDTEYEALGVPRNRALAVNRDARFFDMGLCGPLRKDLARQTQYCGMFLTPTLRNAATRGVYFHNGRYHTLKQVLDFYARRDVDPAAIYPRDKAGHILKYDDLPAGYRANIDVADGPFDRKPGDEPALTPSERDDIIAFIKALNDGYLRRDAARMRGDGGFHPPLEAGELAAREEGGAALEARLHQLVDSGHRHLPAEGF